MTFFRKKTASLIYLLFLAAGSHRSWAADPTLSAKVISASGAQQALSAAEHEAERLHAPSGIAVVDASGILVAFLKMDGVRPGSPDLAIGKARTSALLQRPTAEAENNTNTGRAAFVTSGLMVLRGGVPLMWGTEVVGAIGIAGLNKDNDVAIAEAAAAAFAALSKGQPTAH
jgi:glc operon protein GlcG